MYFTVLIDRDLGKYTGSYCLYKVISNTVIISEPSERKNRIIPYFLFNLYTSGTKVHFNGYLELGMLLYLETGYYNYATYLIYALPKTIDKNN